MRCSVHPGATYGLPLSVAVFLLACAGPAPTVEPVEQRVAYEVVLAALTPVVTEIGVSDLEIEYPNDGEIYVAGADAFVAGRVLTSAPPQKIDLMLVVDTSLSTKAPSGADVDGDGIRASAGRGGQADTDDSILAAEIAALRALLGGMDPRAQRAGVISFSGSPYGDRRGDPREPRGKQPDASQTEVPLTRDFDRCRATLDAIAARGAWGLTDIAGALDRAVEELTGGRRAESTPDPEAHRIVIFLTDGTPTLPHISSRKRNEIEVLRAADRAAKAGVRVYSFAISPRALKHPVAAVEMARRTGGLFMPVHNPALLEAAMGSLQLNAFEALTLKNRTTGLGADRLRVGTDGTWDALIGLAPGKNRLEALITVEGARHVARRTVHYAPGSAEPFVPEDLAARHARLLDGAGRDSQARRRQRQVIELLVGHRDAVQREADSQLRELEPTPP
ncbi:MAG: VWA domain-containing protein [Deltaproteobacteria bacterium]|nr:VWA domain-containing protein [Deltaproteobacteria bacterium]MBW2448351.1 VWA domain-containing protein [Deltaproteobacteria bacterium]